MDPRRTGVFRRPVRAVLRDAARQDASARVGGQSGGLRRLGPRAAAARDPRRDGDAGRRVFETTACINCHAIGGTAANGRFGPDLTHLMSRQHDRVRRGREHDGEPAPVDREPGRHQARVADAGHEAERRGSGRARPLSADAPVVEELGDQRCHRTRWPFRTAQVAGRPWVETLHEWVTTVDHKRLGILYILYALVFLVIGGIEAMIIRIQLMYPHNDFVSPQVFNRMFTMHGTTMIFFVVMPIMFGFANYLVPLMIGARDMAFPRLNAFSFWLTAFGGFLLYFSFLGGRRTVRRRQCTGHRVVGLCAVGLARHSRPATARTTGRSRCWSSGFGSIGTAINIIATILCMRCPGMHLGRMPLLAWLNLVMSGMVLIAITPLSAAQIMLLVDRYLGGHFFDTQAGGSATLWMHFFWIFGHPEVYVLVIPCFAFISEIIPVFSRKPMFGYPVMVAATVGIAFVSMSVWAHHMFTIGMNSYANSFFAITTMAVGVPTGIKIFNWLGTMWGGRIQFKTPMLFCIAFLFQFLIAGLTGIMLASAPFNWQLSGSYFVVAHFHYVIVGGILFALFAAFYYWYPKVTGQNAQRAPGQAAFLAVRDRLPSDLRSDACPGAARHAASHLHLRARPRLGHPEPARHDRAHSSRPSAILVFVANLVVSYWKGAEGRERSLGCVDARMVDRALRPPHTTLLSIPAVASRRPLWDLKHPEDPDSRYE